MNIAERMNSEQPGMVGARGPEQGLGMRRWHMVALGAILLLSALLEFWHLNQLGYENTYYAAAIKSMLMSWHNFFFVSFDPGGFVTIDKPPLGFWIQTASAKLFGFSGFSILLPEALAGVLSVALLYYLVSRIYGSVPGLLAALALALTPISVVTDRNNTIDSLLVLTVLLGAWAVTRAVETGKLRWLLLCALFVGLGFNIKMLEAYLVLPAFGLMYLLGSPVGWGRRIMHLLLAMVVLVGVSFSWIVAVDLVPAAQRPYVGSSQTNSELELALGYNGAQRLLGMRFGGRGGGAGARNDAQQRATSVGQTGTGGQANGAPGNGAAQPGQPPQNGGGGFGGGGGMFGTGNPGPLRLFSSTLGTQISWLLPLAIIGFLVAAWAVSRSKALLPLNGRQKSLLLWGMWLLTMGVFFSVAGFFHPYYMVMMAPAIAALVGIGVVAMWQQYRAGGWWGLLLPAALLVTVAVQAVLLVGYPTFSSTLTPVISTLCVLAAIVLVVLLVSTHLRPAKTRDVETGMGHEVRNSSTVPRLAVMLGMLSLLIVPTAWSAVSLLQGGGGGLPQAGPANFGPFGGNAPAGANASRNSTRGSTRNTVGSRSAFGRGGDPFSQTDNKLTQYLLAHQGNAKYLLAMSSANEAAPLILSTGKPVMALGGFSGGDPILTTQQLAGLVRSGTVRYFMVQSFNVNALPEQAREAIRNAGAGGGFPGGGGFGGRSALTSWITSNCKAVPASEWQSSTTGQAGAGFGASQQLYSCAA